MYHFYNSSISIIKNKSFYTVKFDPQDCTPSIQYKGFENSFSTGLPLDRPQFSVFNTLRKPLAVNQLSVVSPCNQLLQHC